jgi:nitroreductase
MNDVVDLLTAHRSVRRFKPDPIPEEHLQAAIRAGQQAATSSNIQAYAAIRITDPAVRDRLVSLTGGQEKVAACPLFLAICGDVRRHRLIAARADVPHASNLEEFLLAVIDATLFAQNMVVAFESMGYGTCYIGGLRNDLPALHEVLRTPEGVWPLFGLCVGTPDQETSVRPRLDPETVLFDDVYPDDAAVLAAVDQYDRTITDWYRSNRMKTPNWSSRIQRQFEELRRTGNSAWYQGAGASFE